MATITPLDAVLGAEIRGVDVGAGVDDSLMRTLTDALYSHRVIVIRDQSLDTDAYLRFGRLWGDPIPHVLDHMRMPGYPDLMTVGNTEKRDEDSKIRNGAALWHTDQSYEKVPASATMLYSIIAPERGGETQYCDMATAYDNLDEETRRRIDDIEVAHKYGRGKRRPGEPPSNPIVNDEQDRRVPPIYHPLVMRHPMTGRKALYALGHGAHTPSRGCPTARRRRCSMRSRTTRSRSGTSTVTSTRWATSWCGTPCRQCTPRLPSTSPRRTRTHGCCGASAYADAPRFMRRRPESYARAVRTRPCRPHREAARPGIHRSFAIHTG